MSTAAISVRNGSSDLRSMEVGTFRVTDVIPGWIEGLQLMRAGEKRRFWIPAELAYGNSSRPDAPKGMLVFDIELVRIQ